MWHHKVLYPRADLYFQTNSFWQQNFLFAQSWSAASRKVFGWKSLWDLNNNFGHIYLDNTETNRGNRQEHKEQQPIIQFVISLPVSDSTTWDNIIVRWPLLLFANCWWVGGDWWGGRCSAGGRVLFVILNSHGIACTFNLVSAFVNSLLCIYMMIYSLSLIPYHHSSSSSSSLPAKQPAREP